MKMHWLQKYFSKLYISIKTKLGNCVFQMYIDYINHSSITNKAFINKYSDSLKTLEFLYHIIFKYIGRIRAHY